MNPRRRSSPTSQWQSRRTPQLRRLQRYPSGPIRRLLDELPDPRLARRNFGLEIEPDQLQNVEQHRFAAPADRPPRQPPRLRPSPPWDCDAPCSRVPTPTTSPARWRLRQFRCPFRELTSNPTDLISHGGRDLPNRFCCFTAGLRHKPCDGILEAVEVRSQCLHVRSGRMRSLSRSKTNCLLATDHRPGNRRTRSSHSGFPGIFELATRGCGRFQLLNVIHRFPSFCSSLRSVDRIVRGVR